MSKERDLLNKAIEMIQIVPMMASIGNVPPDFGSELILEIQELLAQPEQEPVVWQVIGIAGFMYVYNKPIDQVYEHHTVNALYLAPPTREPLSESRIAAIWDDSDKTDVAITRAIEKTHGIGVE